MEEKEISNKELMAIYKITIVIAIFSMGMLLGYLLYSSDLTQCMGVLQDYEAKCYVGNEIEYIVEDFI